MTCDEADELIGAYALDALPPDEMANVRAHLETCAEHRALAAELRAVTFGLPDTAMRVIAPPALRTRVLDAISREPQDHAAVVAPPVSISEARPTSRRTVGSRWLPTQTWGAIAAALLLAVAGLVGWNIALQNKLNGHDDPSRLASRATWIAPLTTAGAFDAHGTVVYYGDEGKAVVFGDSMPALDPSRTYQLWSVGTGKPTSLGLMEIAEDGRGVVAVPYAATDATMLAITVEPAGGSEQPTSAPVFVAKA